MAVQSGPIDSRGDIDPGRASVVAVADPGLTVGADRIGADEPPTGGKTDKGEHVVVHIGGKGGKGRAIPAMQTTRPFPSSTTTAEPAASNTARARCCQSGLKGARSLPLTHRVSRDLESMADLL